MDLKKRRLIWGIAGVAVVAGVILFYFFFFASFTSREGQVYVYVDNDDTYDSVLVKLDRDVQARQLVGFRLLSAVSGYDGHVRPGRYRAGEGTTTLRLFRNMRNGSQEPVRLTVPNVRTMERLAAELGKVLMTDSARWAKCFGDSAFCAAYGKDTATLACLFLPNTYEVYWNVSPEQLLRRMQKESEAFWTPERLKKADAAGLNPDEVIVMASIVDQETANDAEKPMVAGMYLNRYHKGMKLQADPTVKFALKQFGLRRIYHALLQTDSPYNTYRYAGLPPGPICIPSLSSINAVLNFARHNYIYMCAKEDFSGTHNFAVTYGEHMQNAKKYTQALNERGIK